MPGKREQRRLQRVRLKGSPRGRVLAIMDVKLLDLNLIGVSVEHSDPVRAGSIWTVEFPPAFGSIVVSARVVHSRPVNNKQKGERKTPERYESGLSFVGLTAEQQEILSKNLKPLAPTVELAGGQPSS